ncbi:MAG: hypothetical protein PXX73_01140 [Sideroxydans sp.]|nr:hypothetical protein [Sideroxydans sp.]
MHLVILGIILITSLVSASRVCAAPVNGSASSANSYGIVARISSVVYKFVEVNTAPLADTTSQPVAELIEVEQRNVKAKIFRVDSRIFANTFSNTAVAQDSATFTLNTPNRGVNNALSLVGTVTQTAISNDTTKFIQVLSLLVQREAKFEFAYVAPMSRNSRIESHLDCRLYNAGVSKVATLARVEYRVEF